MIYLDNGATTRILPEVVEAMLPYLTDFFGNPSSIHGQGSAGKKAVNRTRRLLADCLGAQPGEIYFTSGGTESDNWALRSAAEAYGERGKHLITTRLEHPAVLETCRYLEGKGYRVTYLEADRQGLVDPLAVERAIGPDTILVSVMCANNEIGTLEPIGEIGAGTKRRGVLFHTDAVQAFGQIPLNVRKLGVDLLSASAHKLGGPKGAGLLYIREGVKSRALIRGGGQEGHLRAGTENVPAIVGFGRAAQLAAEQGQERAGREVCLREYLMEGLSRIPGCIVNGHREKRLPGNVHVCFEGLESEELVRMLDLKGICASGGAACSGPEREPSHVLRAIGLTEREAAGALRLTLNWENTREEMDQTVRAVRETVEKLRGMSAEKPVFPVKL